MQRTLKFVKYLREEGWQPIVLTADSRAYPKTDPSQLSEIPSDVEVVRAFGLDATRHFSIKGRYPGCLAWPDPWISWWPAAVYQGMRLVRRHRPAAIWSTFPIATANMVAGHIARRCSLPWVADLRDPMTMDGYPSDPMRFRTTRRVEKSTMETAQRVIFTANHTRQLYEARYPEHAQKFGLIPNGFDEANYPRAEKVRGPIGERRITLVHSGSLQPDGRNPDAFFDALGMMKAEREISATTLQIVLRASGYEARHKESASRAGVSDLVTFGDYLAYNEAIAEMVDADGLVVFQGASYNHAVPAKLYEYLNAERPIFAIVDRRGETRTVLDDLGVESIAAIDDAAHIRVQLRSFLAALREGRYRSPERARYERYSRRHQAADLSAILAATVAAGRTGNS